MYTAKVTKMLSEQSLLPAYTRSYDPESFNQIYLSQFSDDFAIEPEKFDCETSSPVTVIECDFH